MWLILSKYTSPNADEEQRSYERLETITAILLKKGIHVFSPILCHHQIDKKYNIGKFDVRSDYYKSLFNRFDGLIFLRDSREIRNHPHPEPISTFTRLGKHVVFASNAEECLEKLSQLLVN